MMNEEIVKGDKRTRTLFFLLVLLTPIWLAAITIITEKIPIENDSASDRFLWLTGAVTILALGWAAVFLFSVGVRVYKAHCYPPPGMKVPFTMKLKRGRQANQMAYLCFIASACLFLNIMVKVWVVLTMR